MMNILPKEGGLPRSISPLSKVYIRVIYHIGLQHNGKKWGIIHQSIPTRTTSQIRTHAQKFFNKITEVMPKGTHDVMEYIKSKEATFFIGASQRKCRHQTNKPLMHESLTEVPMRGMALPKGKRKYTDSLGPGDLSVSFASELPAIKSEKQLEPAPASGVAKGSALPQSYPGYSPKDDEENIKGGSGHADQLMKEEEKSQRHIFPHETSTEPWHEAIESLSDNKALKKAKEDLTDFCKKLTADWMLYRTLDGFQETAQSWSFLSATGISLKHLVNSMMLAQRNNAELLQCVLLNRQRDISLPADTAMEALREPASEGVDHASEQYMRKRAEKERQREALYAKLREKSPIKSVANL